MELGGKTRTLEVLLKLKALWSVLWRVLYSALRISERTGLVSFSYCGNKPSTQSVKLSAGRLGGDHLASFR